MTIIKKIKRKVHDSMGISEHSWQESNWSYYRFFKFLGSKRGQKKLWSFCWKVCKFLIKKSTGINITSSGYKKWLKKNFPTPTQIEKYRANEQQLKYRPKISIVLPVYDPPENFFKEAIESVLNQAYTNWELCIADDVSPNENIRTIIKQYAEKDDRIKYVFREKNGHISAASNSAIEIATGEFIALLDHDDLLTPDALYENVLVLNQDKDIDLIYSDEDKIDDRADLSDHILNPIGVRIIFCQEITSVILL